MKVALGADHAGYELKELLALHLRHLGHEVVDVGTSSKEAVDYPRFARAVAGQVAAGRCDRGIVVDGAGIGSAMVANKVRGIRAALAYDLSSARNSREHNDANVLTLGAGLIGPRLAEQIVSVWMESACTEERHLRRVAQIEGEGSRPPASPAAEASCRTGGAIEGISEEDLRRIAEELRRLVAPERAEGRPHVAPGPEAAGPASQQGAAPTGGAGQPHLPEEIARFIDHTLLKPEATAEEIRTLCAEAREHRFAAVCVHPIWTRLVAQELAGTPVKVCTVAGFPLGATPPENKAFEARRSIREGADEIDMVIPIGALKGGDDEAVLRDIRAVVEACRDGSAICKVIIEAALLTDEEKRRACRLARRARAQFVKTSTGFGPGGATAHDVALMAREVQDAGMEVKAAGGIRSLADAMRMIEAGATRIGASAGVAIVREARGVEVRT